MKYELSELKLCDNPNCDKGKALVPTGESAVANCPVCKGHGFLPKEEE